MSHHPAISSVQFYLLSSHLLICFVSGCFCTPHKWFSLLHPLYVFAIHWELPGWCGLFCSCLHLETWCFVEVPICCCLTFSFLASCFPCLWCLILFVSHTFQHFCLWFLVPLFWHTTEPILLLAMLMSFIAINSLFMWSWSHCYTINKLFF